MTFVPYFCSFWGSLIINNEFFSVCLFVILCFSFECVFGLWYSRYHRISIEISFFFCRLFVSWAWAFVDPSFCRPHRYYSPSYLFHACFVFKIIHWIGLVFFSLFVFIRWKMFVCPFQAQNIYIHIQSIDIKHPKYRARAHQSDHNELTKWMSERVRERGAKGWIIHTR